MSIEAPLAIMPLGLEPRLNLDKFRESARAHAGTLCTAHHEGGLNEYHITLSQREYDALGLVQIDDQGQPRLNDAGQPIPLPRKAMPTKPQRPVGAPNAAVLAFYKEDVQLHTDVTIAATLFRTSLLNAAGDLIRAELSTDVGGLAAKTRENILQHIDTHYGTLNSEDVEQLRANINDHQFNSPASLVEDATQVPGRFEQGSYLTSDRRQQFS